MNWERKATRETAKNLRVIDDARFPELSSAVKYFKETEGGFGEMCKTVEAYAKYYAEEREKIGRAEGRSEERRRTVQKMLQKGMSREQILSLDYSETELKAAEQEMLAKV